MAERPREERLKNPILLVVGKPGPRRHTWPRCSTDSRWLDHKGANWGSAWQHPYWGQFYSLSHLGLARGSALAGDPTKAGKAYQDFLTLWKDADADIPVLKQAKAEYAKLQ